MEVSATIFMICVFHVLCSFTFPSRQRDRSQIRQENIRRIPIVYYQNQDNGDINDEETQPETAVGYIMPYLESQQDTNPNQNNESGKSLEDDPNTKLLRESNSYGTANNFLSRAVTVAQDKISWLNNESLPFNSKMLVSTKKSIMSHILDSFHRKKLKPLSRDNKCSSIEPFFECKECITTTCKTTTCKTTTCKTTTCKTRKTKTPEICTESEPETPLCQTTCPPCCYPATTLNPCLTTECPVKPWLRNTGLPELSFMSNGHSNFSSNDTYSPDYIQSNFPYPENLLFSSTLPNVIEQSESITNIRHRKKRKSFLIAKNELKKLKKKLTRRLPRDTKRIIRTSEVQNGLNEIENKILKTPVGMELLQNIFKILVPNGEHKIKKRTMVDERKIKRSAAHVEFFPLGKNFKKCNISSKTIPQCQKSCYYNLTALVNAQTIKPPNYFRKKGPSLVLCCPNKEDMTTSTSSTTQENELDLLENQSTSPSENITESALPEEITNVTTVPTVYKIHMEFRDRKTESTSTRPREQFILKLMMKNNEDLNDAIAVDSNSEVEKVQWPMKNLILIKPNDEPTEKSLEGYMMKEVGRRKKPNPWDKFCSCNDLSSTCCTENITEDIIREPWMSTCCYSVTSGLYPEEVETGQDYLAKTMAYGSTRLPKMLQNLIVTSNPSSLTPNKHSSLKPDVRYMSANKQELLNLLQGRANDKESIVVLVRVPIAIAQKYGNNGTLNLVLPVNNTLLKKYIKPRSILNQLLPCIMKKTTQSSRDPVAKPWVEPWKFKQQEKFSLFTTHSVQSFPRDVDCKNEKEKTKLTENESHNIDPIKKLPDTCPSCGRSRNDMFLKASKYPKLSKFSIIGENDKLYEELVSDSLNNKLTKEGCDEKCITYLLKLPKERLEKSSSVSYSNSRRMDAPLKTLKLIQKYDSPPKYFIEVPDNIGELIKKAGSRSHSTFSSHTNAKKSSLKNETPEKMLLRTTSQNKPIKLYLQPFVVNGHNIYLPMPGFKNSAKSKVRLSAIDQNDVSGDYFDSNDLSNNLNELNDKLLYKNDSNFPFALIPAYLTIHPNNKLRYDLNVHPKKNMTDCSFERGSQSDIYSKIKLNDHVSGLMGSEDAIPIEKKWLKLAQQIENTLQNPLPGSSKHTGSSKKSICGSEPKSAINKHLEKPTYIIVMKEMASEMSPHLEEVQMLPIGDVPISENINTLHNKNEDFAVIDNNGDLVTIGNLKGSSVLN